MIKYPECKKIETSERIFGTELKDDYRWLEDGKAEDTLAWVKAENEFTDEWFKGKGLEERIETLKASKPGPTYNDFSSCGDGYLALENNDGVGRVVYYSGDLRSKESVLEKYEIPDYVPWMASACPTDPDIVYAGGPYDGDARPTCIIMNRRTKEVLAEIGNGFYNSWALEGRRFYYSVTEDVDDGKCRSTCWIYDVDSKENKLVFTDRGYTIFADTYGLPGRKMLMQMREDYVKSRYYIYDEDLDATFVVTDNPLDITFIGAKDDALFFIDKEDAEKGKLFRVPMGAAYSEGKTIREESLSETLEEGFVLGDKVYLIAMENASSKLIEVEEGFDERGETKESGEIERIIEREIELPNSPCELMKLGADSKGAYIQFQSFTHAERVLKFDGEKLEELIKREGDKDFDGIEVEQLWAASKDGTMIPYYLVRNAGLKPSGDIPCMMYAYGGYNSASLPDYRNPATSLAIGDWVERGGIYILLNIRGGSEFGTPWHEGGMLMNKKNCYYDFIGITEKLIADGWTNPKRIVITGLSNGGLMVSALVTMRPDLFGCAIDSVPHTDMIHFALDGRGAMYTTEYGNPFESKEMFEYMLSYSPYHNVREVEYPPIYIQTGECDNNVPPYHGKKFAAKLQEMNKSDSPILLRVLAKGSHDRGSGEEFFKTSAEMQLFLEEALGV